MYRCADKSLARPTSECILFNGENISFDANLVIYINSTNILPIMIVNRIYEHQNLLSLQLVSFLVGLRTQHPCTLPITFFWDMTLCQSAIGSPRLERQLYLRLQGPRIPRRIKMKALRSLERPETDYRMTCHEIPQKNGVLSDRCKGLKSRN